MNIKHFRFHHVSIHFKYTIIYGKLLVILGVSELECRKLQVVNPCTSKTYEILITVISDASLGLNVAFTKGV